ncbi:putative protein [Arabidopsis thaliana]|uniref:Uncharacterized protein F16L2_30 n=2 Tax=Arabidopsis thaliana TaxID=3702 RepID=Q9LZU8_ARATH|nr:uncharacterized protein AT3G45820 [Arabidopsis thaliana]AEE78077.1 hypothetical protein AT3G45820 [Arabidopsis thaliana]CAB82806.1 putative protein [Arabidopsis thaliana]VYS59470.1 unnamed protein product [Arabidopsis thaliana]|eukprot:NP_190168.1 hypothetical protein AT3G45820 [Arabidopsis thaliana]
MNLEETLEKEPVDEEDEGDVEGSIAVRLVKRDRSPCHLCSSIDFAVFLPRSLFSPFTRGVKSLSLPFAQDARAKLDSDYINLGVIGDEASPKSEIGGREESLSIALQVAGGG